MKLSARFTVTLPYSSLEQTAMSHGWVQLSPFEWDDQHKTLSRRERVGRQLATLVIRQTGKRIVCSCYSSSLLTETAKRELRQRFLYMMGHEIQLSDFLSLAKRLDPQVYLFAQRGGARLLRSTTLFEDTAKTLFTTNASWQFTRQMCQRLMVACNSNVSSLANSIPFPSVKQVDATSITIFEKDCRLGYRSTYLKNIARKFVECHSFTNWAVNDILACLSEVKGVGQYSINHLGMLLGKWDRIPIDSEVRSYVREVRRADDPKSIHAHYAHWHPYEFLAYKIERRILQKNWIGERLKPHTFDGNSEHACKYV